MRGQVNLLGGSSGSVGGGRQGEWGFRERGGGQMHARASGCRCCDAFPEVRVCQPLVCRCRLLTVFVFGER